jgi:hypothetical protein
MRPDPFSLLEANSSFFHHPRCCVKLPVLARAARAQDGWGVYKLGPYDLYDPSTGMMQDGFRQQRSRMRLYCLLFICLLFICLLFIFLLSL